MPVLQETGPLFPSGGKWKYLGWFCQQDLFWEIILWHCLCNPTSPPWGPIQPEASLEDTFLGLGLAAWSHWCIFQKHAATSHATNWLLVQELCFLRAELRCRGVSGTCTELPELTWDSWVQQNYQTLLFPPASRILPQSLSLLCNGLMQAVGSNSWGQPLAGHMETGAMRKGPKTPQTSALRGGWSEYGL